MWCVPTCRLIERQKASSLSVSFFSFLVFVVLFTKSLFYMRPILSVYRLLFTCPCPHVAHPFCCRLFFDPAALKAPGFFPFFMPNITVSFPFLPFSLILCLLSSFVSFLSSTTRDSHSAPLFFRL